MAGSSAAGSAGQGSARVTVTRTNPLYGQDGVLIRVAPGALPDALAEAIASHLADRGSVYLELPDGRLTVVLDLDGMSWIPRAADEGLRG